MSRLRYPGNIVKERNHLLDLEDKKDLALTFHLWKRIRFVLGENITKGYGCDASPLGGSEAYADNTIHT